MISVIGPQCFCVVHDWDETKEKNQDFGGCEQKNKEKINSLASHEP